MNNIIAVSRERSQIFDKIFFTAWGENAELLRNSKENAMVELTGWWKVENWVSKDGVEKRRDVLNVETINFLNVELEDEPVVEMPDIEISEDDLPF